MVGEGVGGWIERMICLDIMGTKAAVLAIFTLANSILLNAKSSTLYCNSMNICGNILIGGSTVHIPQVRSRVVQPYPGYPFLYLHTAPRSPFFCECAL